MEPERIRIIPSKSYAHRAYICDFLAGGSGDGVLCCLDSDDIKATRRCLRALGNGDEDLDCGESGSTLRFMLPLAGVLGKRVRLLTSGKLSERPTGPLEDELMRHGMTIEHPAKDVILASGKLSPGGYRLPGDISSQFISGLMLSLPYLDGDSTIEMTSELKSSAYVDITEDVLREYGVVIRRQGDAFLVPGRSSYHRDGIYETEGDWSQAAFWLAAGAICSVPVKVVGLKEDSVQGDRKIVEILRSMGADIRADEEGAASYPSGLKGVTTDISEVPDLAPAIAAAAAFAEGDTRLTDAGRLRLKESDRIESIVRCVRSLGGSAEGASDEIVIHGGRKLSGGRAETAGDHRIVMMAAVMSLGVQGSVEIEEKEAVNKSYPGFFGEFERCFGRI